MERYGTVCNGRDGSVARTDLAPDPSESHRQDTAPRVSEALRELAQDAALGNHTVAGRGGDVGGDGASTAVASAPLAACSIDALALAQFSSERELTAALRASLFAADVAAFGRPRIVLLTCDPSACTPALVAHARHIAAALRDERRAWRRLEAPPALRRAVVAGTGNGTTGTGTGGNGGGSGSSFMPVSPCHIVFVVHLPPGLKRDARFALEFDAEWRAMHSLFVGGLLRTRRTVTPSP